MKSQIVKCMLFAVLAAPLALHAQPVEAPAAPQTTTDSKSAKPPRTFRSVLRTIAHDLNPTVWFNYLSHREPCSYAWWQAYATCGPQAAQTPQAGRETTAQGNLLPVK